MAIITGKAIMGLLPEIGFTGVNNQAAILYFPFIRWVEPIQGCW